MDWNRRLGRRSLFRLVGAGTGAYLLSGCAPASPAPAQQSGSPAAPQASPIPTAGAPATSPAVDTRPTVRMAAVRSQGIFEAPNPFTSNTGPAGEQTSYIFDSLVQRDSTVTPIPWLAEKWTSSSDGTEWTFNLRPGVRFHDGEPLTAADVEFSYQFLSSRPPGQVGQLYRSVQEVVKDAEALDERTVRITLKTPFAPFLNSIASTTPVLPKHIWAGVSDPKTFNDPGAYLGSGPYRVSAMSETDSSMLFVANDDFFLGKPYVKRMEFLPFGDALVALKAGQLDMATPSAATGLSREALSPFRGDPKFAIIEAPGEATTALHFNLSRGEPYSDVSFRRAVFYAIDRQDMVDRLLGGNGEIGSAGFLPPANPYFSREVEQYPYDLQKARALLDEAGYGEQDGQRRMPDGSPLALPLLFASPSARVAEFIRNQLAQVGIKVDLRSVDPGTTSQLQGVGTYDLSIVTYGGLGSDPDFVRRTFGSPDSQQFWYKAWGYKNPEFDGPAAEQIRTFDDARRRSLVNQMQRIVSQDVPIMPLFYPNRYVIYVPEVFDAWYFTPLYRPLAMNKHFLVTGQKTGLSIRQR
jgi:peptide/nickel transport system substrate-binding protein